MSNSASIKLNNFFSSSFLYTVFLDIYVPQGRKKSSFEQSGVPWFVDEEEKEKEEVDSEFPVKATKEEVIAEPEDESEAGDNSNVGKSKSVITR